MAVQAVAVLVHRREERLERVGVVVRRDPDVVAAGAGGERVLGRVEPPALGTVSEQVDHFVRERALPLGREVAVQERVVQLSLAQLGDQRHERRLELLEQRPHLGGRGLGLEVVEQDVVALRRAVRQAVDVPQLQLDDPLERRQEGGEVRLRLRLHPDRPRLGRRPRHLRPQRRRHLHGLLVIASRHADQGRVVGVGVERLLARAAPRAAVPSPVRDPLVREPLDERHLLCAVPRPRRRHHGLLVPGEDPRDLLQADDLAQPLLEPLERVRHQRPV